jgi:Tfp pilus assembly protein PilV
MRSRLRREDGFTLIEGLVAALVLVTGLLGTLTALDGSRQLTTTAERQTIATHRAEQQIERIRAIPFASLELASAPGTSTDPNDPRSGVSGTSYDWDRQSASNALEALAIKPAAATNPDAIAPRTTWSDGRYSGTLDTFVTTVIADKLKRVTVAVKLDGTARPRTPIYVTTLASAASETQEAP